MVNRKIENFTVVEAEALWGGQISISVNDPDGGGFSLSAPLERYLFGQRTQRDWHATF